MEHEFDRETTSEGEADQRSGSGAAHLLEAAARIAGGDAAFCFGRDKQRTFPKDRSEQIARLQSLRRVDLREVPLLGTGGEHQVYAAKSESEDRIVKVTLPGVYGRTVDEDILLDSRTFLNVSKLKLRDARPSEYFLRWALLDEVFGLQTRLEGVVGTEGSEPQIVISQPFIGQDMPTDEEVDAQMHLMGFEKVEARHVANPENIGCTWYRRLDGILITDAFPRNFRLELESGFVVPIDLMVNLVPPGLSTILPSAATPFQLPIS